MSDSPSGSDERLRKEHPLVICIFQDTIALVEIRQTQEYAHWFQKLRDAQARGRILARIRRLSLGNPGDVAPVGQGVSELRIDYGPGYRIYFKQQGESLAILLTAGDKSSQERDIKRAQRIAGRL